MVRLLGVCRGWSGFGSAGEACSGALWSVAVMQGSARQAGYGLFGLGYAGCCKVGRGRRGAVRFGEARWCEVCLGELGHGRRGSVRFVMLRSGESEHGTAGKVRLIEVG